MTATAMPMAATPGRLATRDRILDVAVTAMAVASTCVIVGLIWDISWHRTIGRDTFWTPAHMAIYSGGIISGLVCATLVFSATFGRDPAMRAATVRFWGFRGPMGAWIAIWGAIAMLTSAPFDNWWHNAYGLDVKVLSPPHALLGLGMMSIQIGSLLLVASRQHGAVMELAGWRKALPYWVAGLWLAMLMEMVFQYRLANAQHGVDFYFAIALTGPLALAAAARGFGGKWPATTTALCYTVVGLLMVWILPIFPATPLLGPIYNPITHMVAPPFPLLLVFPAIAIDLLLARDRWYCHRPMVRSLVAGFAFVAILLLVQWPFSKFLLSPAARNPIFGADQWDYATRIGPGNHQFWDELRTSTGGLWIGGYATGLLKAVVGATLTTRLGIAFGNWVARVKR